MFCLPSSSTSGVLQPLATERQNDGVEKFELESASIISVSGSTFDSKRELIVCIIIIGCWYYDRVLLKVNLTRTI